MKTLILVRHAKAEELASTDFDRRLHPKGIRQCAEVVEQLQEMKLKADWIIASDAMRTKETACLLAPSVGYDVNRIEWEHKLYHANAIQIIDVITAIDNKVNTLMLVGHNNGLSEAINELTRTFKYSLQTSDYVILTFENSWHDIRTSRLTVVKEP